MSFDLTESQWAKIHAAQATEIRRIMENTNYARQASKRPHYSKIGSWLKENSSSQRALEIGCGPGRYVALLAALGYEVVGADPLPYPDWEQFDDNPLVSFKQGVSAEELPFDDQDFDAVACMGALLYFDDDNKACAEMNRVLKPGGRLVVRTVQQNSLFQKVRGRYLDPATVNVYTPDTMTKLLENNGFKVDECFSYGFYPPYFEGHWWRLVHKSSGLATQELISSLCPPRLRINLNAFATKL